MDEIMETRFQNMETTVNTLIESMTTFNPSISAAEALMEADIELDNSIDTLAEHQANHDRLVVLRAMAETLDGQIKSTIQLIADTRQEVLNLPWTPVNESLRSVSVDELLTFAKHISKNTLPPSGVNRAIEVSTPVVTEIPEVPVISVAEETPIDGLEALLRKNVTFANSVIPENQQTWLDEEQRRSWVPWPTEDIIRVGGLAELTRRAAEGQTIPNTLVIDTKVAAAPVAEDLEIPSSAKDLLSAGDELPSAGPARYGERPKKTSFHGFGLYNPDEDES